jgi:hypothetical protein
LVLFEPFGGGAGFDGVTPPISLVGEPRDHDFPGSGGSDRKALSRPIDPESRMTIADLVYKQVKLLPDPLAREVLDFVGFLREGRDRAEWRDLMNAQSTGLAAIWDNPEDKVWDDV